MGWKKEVFDLIRGSFAIGETFRLDQAYKFVPELKQKYPNNNHIRDKVRQILQNLRDDGHLEFIDYQGTYKRLK